MDPLKNEPPKPKSRFKPVARPRLVPKNVVINREVKAEPDVAKDMLERFNQQKELKISSKSERKVEPTTHEDLYTASRSINNRYQASSYHHTQKTNLKDYVEPWDYYGHYPVTLPLRMPYSGDPVLLDKEEFGVTKELCENSSNDATDLGLMVEQEEPTILSLQLPFVMPMKKQMVTAESTGVNEGSKPQRALHPRQMLCLCTELPAGHTGKMVLCKSGAVKFKFGDVMYNVSPGLSCVFGQHWVARNTKDRFFCAVGEINKRAVVTPDFDSVIHTI